MVAKIAMNAAELTRYVTDTHDRECTIAAYLEAKGVNGLFEQVWKPYRTGTVGPDYSPFNEESLPKTIDSFYKEHRRTVQFIWTSAESKRIGAEFMRRHRLRIAP